MQIFDITRTLSADLPAWPGDVSFRYQVNGRIAEGGNVNVGSISMSLHNGTHGDASYHFDDNGWTIEQAKLETYFGPAVLIDLSERYAGAPEGGRFPQVQLADLEQAVHSFIDPLDASLLRLQELAAVLASSDRRYLPPRYQELDRGALAEEFALLKRRW